MLGKTLLTQTQTAKERERIVSRGWCLRFSLCAFAVLLWVCVCCRCCYRPSAFVVDFVSSRGMDWFVCVCFCFVFVSSARSFSLCLSVLSHCLCLSQLFSLPTCTDLHLNLITFTRKYYLFYYVFLLPLICNNSCILRDATVCVCFCVCCLHSTEEGGLPYCSCLSACVLVCCLWGGVILFTCNSSIGFLLVVGVAELFFIINFLFFFLSAVCGCDSRDVSISNGRGISFYQQQCCSWWQSQFLRRMI